MGFYDFVVKDKEGNDVSLEKFRGKTVLVVNSATGCYFSHQYAQLQQIYEEMKGRDFEILDFPCNQFGQQAPGSSQEIAKYCTVTFGVEYEQFAKIDVYGENAEPLFVWLQQNTKFKAFGFDGYRINNRSFCKNLKKSADMGEGQIYWNFTKFLIDGEGNIVARYEPNEPLAFLREDINRLINGDNLTRRGAFSRKNTDVASKTEEVLHTFRRKKTGTFFLYGYVTMLASSLFLIFYLKYPIFPPMVIRLLIFSALGATIISLFFRQIFRNIELRINQLSAALEQTASGNLNYRLNTQGNFFFNKPFADFNHMADIMKDSMTRMEAAAAEAERANNAKSDFLSNMSHEMRTPLNAVLGMDEMIIRETTDEEIKKYAIDIRNAGKTLLSLINDILDLSKIEAKKMEIVEVEYDLSSVINDLYTMIYEKINAKNLELNLHVDPAMPHIFVGDEVRIKQICLNILNNATKYTDEGSIDVDFSVETVDEKRYLCFACKDTGQGIREEDLARLFEPFSRINEKKNRNVEGTGLGVAITQQLLELMGSKLEVQSEFGKGSVFSFKVLQKVVKEEPIGDFSEAYERYLKNTEQYRESFIAPNAKLLVVDDVELNLSVVKNFLKTTQLQITTALSGMEAIEKADVTKFDLILVDHMMPDMDGFDTLKAIRAKGANVHTPVVVLTANAVSGARERYMTAGFDDYLTKPVDSIKLEKMITKYLPSDLVELVEVNDNSEQASDNPVLQRIASFDYMDVNQGIQLNGSVDAYLGVLENFVATAPKRIKMIKDFYEAENIPDYTIQVHALKSSARIVGANELSGLAKELEERGNASDVDTIKAKTEALLSMYGKVVEDLAPEFEADSGKEQIDEDMLRDGITAIYEALSVFDFDMADGVFKALDEYSMPDYFAEAFGKIKAAMADVDRDEIIKLLQPFI